MTRIVPAALVAGTFALVFATCTPRPDRSPPDTRPRSIILITIDTLRADHVTAQLTPALDGLRAAGVYFPQAVTSAPLTAPAHASLLTGLYPPRHGVRDNALFTLPATVPSLAELLKSRGYSTGAFVSAIVLDSRYGLDRGFDIYDDEIAAVERAASDTLTRAQDWIVRARHPLLAWIHLFEPHAPYVTGSYAGDVATVDRALGSFFTFLRERHLWDDAIIAVVSDHGEALGDHGEQTHGFYLYDAVLKIPWILKAPDLRPSTYPSQVRIVDVLPTMMSLAGQSLPAATASPAEGLDGVDLSQTIRGGSPPQLEAYAETFLPRHQFGWSDLRALRTETSKYIKAPKDELYDLAEDPGEVRNVVALGSDRRGAATRALDAIERVAAQHAPRLGADPDLAERFMSLGYIGYSAPSTSRHELRLADPKDKLEVYMVTMKALELAEQGRKEAALAEVDRAIALDGNVAQLFFLRGTFLGDLGRYEAAVVALARTIELNPRYVTARFKLALAYLRLQRYDRAEQTLQTVVQDEPGNVRAWHNLAAVAYARGDVQRAEALEKKAIEIDRTYAEAWNTLGAIYLVTKRPAQALDALKTALDLRPNNAQTTANLALAYRALGRATDADAAQRQACQLDKRYCR